MNPRRTSLVGSSLLALVLLAGCSARRPVTTAPRAPAPVAADTGVVLLEDFAGRAVFPASNGWNLDASAAPVDSNSQAYIAWISGRTAQNPAAVRHLHPDFGPPPYGIPYVGVSGDAGARARDLRGLRRRERHRRAGAAARLPDPGSGEDAGALHRGRRRGRRRPTATGT